MLVPSKANPMGLFPEGGLVPARNVPKLAPSTARSLLTAFEPFTITQMLSPSKAMDPAPLGKANFVVRLAGYQRRVATCWGFLVEVVTPPWASAEPHSPARARGTRMLKRIVF